MFINDHIVIIIRVKHFRKTDWTALLGRWRKTFRTFQNSGIILPIDVAEDSIFDGPVLTIFVPAHLGVRSSRFLLRWNMNWSHSYGISTMAPPILQPNGALPHLWVCLSRWTGQPTPSCLAHAFPQVCLLQCSAFTEALKHSAPKHDSANVESIRL